MRGGQQLSWRQHPQRNQTTARTTSVDEAASACPGPGQGSTRVAADPGGGDTTASKVQVNGDTGSIKNRLFDGDVFINVR